MSSYMNTPAFVEDAIPAFGNFDPLGFDEHEKEMLHAGFQAVDSVEGGWEFLRTYEPPEDKGFMFSLPTGKRAEIDEAISARYGGHSGSSYGWTMRVLEAIAKMGWESWAKHILQTRKRAAPQKQGPSFNEFLDIISPSTKDCKPDTTLTPEQKREKFLALPTNMTLDEQARALRELGDVPMTYFEMRSRFG